MTTAIIFDCFGVLTSDGWLPFKTKYFGHDPALYGEATRLNKQADTGLGGYEAFMASIARLAGIDVQQAHSEININVADAALFHYIATELKPHYQLGLLSNAGANWLPQLFTTDQMSLFDAVALSYEMGFIKPELQAYQKIAQRLDVPPDQCVLIDDQPLYCEGARAAGMQALTYTTLSRLRQELPLLLAE